MLLLFTLIFVLVLGHESTCTEELAQVIYRPKSCEYSYFKKLENSFSQELAYFKISNGFYPDTPSLNTGRFCNQYEIEHGVSLNIYNAYNQDLCILKNPCSDGMFSLWKLMLTKTRQQRYTIYVESSSYFDYLYPIPQVDSPDMDVVGIQGIFVNLTEATLESSDKNPLPFIGSLISYISTFLGNEPQSQMDLNAALQFSQTVMALALPDVEDYFNKVQDFMNFPGTNIELFVNPLQFTISGLAYIEGLTAFNFTTLIPYSEEERSANYARVLIYMKQLMANFGIVDGFSQPVSLVALDGSLCTFGSNQFLPDGKIIRVYYKKLQTYFFK